MYYTYTLSFIKYYNRVDWLFIVKIKPRSLFQVVYDSNDKVIEEEDIFQLDDLVSSSIELEKYSNFHATKNIYV